MALVWFKKFCECVLNSSTELNPPINDIQSSIFKTWENNIRSQITLFFTCIENIDNIKNNYHKAENHNLNIDRLEKFITEFNHIEKQHQREIIENADLFLQECVTRKFRGDFYTPLCWVQQSHTIIDKYYPKWQENLVWDSSCGTGNLTVGREYKLLIQTTLFEEDINIMNIVDDGEKTYLRKQYDFLSEMKAPDYVLEKINHCNGVLFLNNPPFKTGANLDSDGCSSKTIGVSKTLIGQLMKKDKFNNQQIYNHFMYKITRLAEEWYKEDYPIYNAVFLPTNAFCGTQDSKFLDYFFSKWEFLEGFIFPLSEFKGTSGADVSVCFTLWKFGKATGSKELPLTIMSRIKDNIIPQQIIPTYYGQQSDFLNDWWKQDHKNIPLVPCVPLSNAMTIFSGKSKSIVKDLPKGYIGYFHSGSPTMKENNQQVYILSSARANGHGCALVPIENKLCILKAFAAFFVRRALILPPNIMWKIGHINIRNPNINLYNQNFNTWASNCAVYSCFNSKSLQASMRHVVFDKVEYNIKNEFFFMSMNDMKKLAETHGFIQMLYDLENFGGERFMFTFLEDSKNLLYPEAIDVLTKAKILWEQSFHLRPTIKYIEIKKGTKKEKIDAYLQCWDTGWYQVRSMLKTIDNPKIKGLMNDLTTSVVCLRNRLWYGIIEFNFLPKQILSVIPTPENEVYDSDDNENNLTTIDNCITIGSKRLSDENIEYNISSKILKLE